MGCGSSKHEDPSAFTGIVPGAGADGALRGWLASTGIKEQFLQQVLATCNEQMIGSVDDFHSLRAANKLGTIFPAVVAHYIELGLDAVPGSNCPEASAETLERLQRFTANTQFFKFGNTV